LVDICTVDADFLTNMDAIKIEDDLDNSLSSVASTGAIHLSHMGHESEEDVPVPFIFVDVNVSQEEPYFVRIKRLNSLMLYNLVAQTHYP
jgi:hypothetical protein